ncbi:hypothetical protein F4813DRAFT_394350 [Daldinia decipiens]|uniref:uncharacterized protein n=1 Tax=Daldinia decipiens TaxID=326647 RepID=UPI0020C27822|nr:uncharacterized protein F4813DRAFT_394350 [Daldinia decipiens]KAI1652802.1 hypothetical protein F4813DRAFT_394350 [Daldinia decipiens]
MTMINRINGLPYLPDEYILSERLSIPHWRNTTDRLESIQLSSRTTGKPKGVELAHYNLVLNCYQLVAHDREQSHPSSWTVAFTLWTHITMTTLPLFLGPYTGMLHHAMPNYNIEEFTKLVGSNQATTFQGVPSVVLQMANSNVISRFDFSGAKYINAGGPLKNDLKYRLLSKVPWRLI